MDGVTILSEMSVRNMPLDGVIVFAFLAITVIGCVIFLSMPALRCPIWKIRIVGIIIPLMVIVFMSIHMAILGCEYNIFHTKYKVIIDDSVGFNEFTNRYEIISTDGDVYTVIERECNNETN